MMNSGLELMMKKLRDILPGQTSQHGTLPTGELKGNGSAQNCGQVYQSGKWDDDYCYEAIHFLWKKSQG